MQNQEWDEDMKTEQDHNAYMLVYEKVVQVPFKIDLDPNHVSLIKQGADVKLPYCYTLYPNLID